jgi:hypothetical protein
MASNSPQVGKFQAYRKITEELIAPPGWRMRISASWMKTLFEEENKSYKAA